MPHGLLYGASFTKGTLSFTDKQGRTICSADLWNFLTLTATSDNSSVKLVKYGTLSNKFEVNVGNGWEEYAFDTVIPLKAGQSCKWRCPERPTMQSGSNYVKFVMTGTIEASGNCNSMLSSYFENLTSLSENDWAFFRLFKECTSLVKAPILPATTLAPSCYASMFYGCNSLKEAPSLPATVLTSGCYSNMFYGCTSLVNAPGLPATHLASNCCESMFYGCASLVNAPELPATTLADDCYRTMFIRCTSLVNAPELPATTLASSCYYSMFKECTSLVKAPSLPAKTLVDRCYYSMFYGCKALTEVRVYATTETDTNALTYWLTNVAATGDFYCDPNATIFPTDSSFGIPLNWTRHDIADYPTT